MTEHGVADQRLRDAGAVLSGYLYLAVAAVLTLLLMPVYARLLGDAGWGDVALCLGVQGALFGLDAVFGPLLLREVALADREGQGVAVHRRFLRLYGGIALLLFGGGQLALVVLDHRLPADHDGLLLAARLALVQFLFQFANLATVGAWHGRQRQAFANMRLVAFALCRHAGALLILLLASPSAPMFFVPFAVVAFLEFTVNLRRMAAEQRSVERLAPGDALAASARLRSDGLGTFIVAALLGVLVAHVDRLYFALTLPREQYGHYFLCGVLLLALLHLQMPLQRAFVPRIVAAHDPAAALARLRRWMFVLLALPCLLLALLPEWLLRLWLGNPDIAAAGAPVLQLMLIAAAALALAAPAQAMLLRAARYRAMIGLNGVAVLVQLTLLAVLAPRLGMVAGGLAWLAVALWQLAVSSWLTRPRRRRPAVRPAGDAGGPSTR